MVTVCPLFRMCNGLIMFAPVMVNCSKLRRNIFFLLRCGACRKRSALLKEQSKLKALRETGEGRGRARQLNAAAGWPVQQQPTPCDQPPPHQQPPHQQPPHQPPLHQPPPYQLAQLPPQQELVQLLLL